MQNFRFFRCKTNVNTRDSQKGLKTILKKQYDELGPYSWRKRAVTILFVVLVVLWVKRDFSSSPGWKIIFKKECKSELSLRKKQLLLSFQLCYRWRNCYTTWCIATDFSRSKSIPKYLQDHFDIDSCLFWLGNWKYKPII